MLSDVEKRNNLMLTQLTLVATLTAGVLLFFTRYVFFLLVVYILLPIFWRQQIGWS